MVKQRANKQPKPRSSRRNAREPLIQMEMPDQPIPNARPQFTDFKPVTPAQSQFAAAIDANTLTFGLGPAGTGKTHVPVSKAAVALRDKEVQKIIITRPAVEAGESLGFLPGELDEKFDPYFAPVRVILEKALGAGFVEYLVKAERIVALPLAHMRGHTFEDCWVILDEAQNTTPTQMKLFLTRIGENCKVIVNGDISQKDIAGPSGLCDAVDRLNGVKSVGVFEFDEGDIMRSGLVREVLKRYRDYNK